MERDAIEELIHAVQGRISCDTCKAKVFERASDLIVWHDEDSNAER
jgi:hypothetical protein